MEIYIYIHTNTHTDAAIPPSTSLWLLLRCPAAGPENQQQPKGRREKSKQSASIEKEREALGEEAIVLGWWVEEEEQIEGERADVMYGINARAMCLVCTCVCNMTRRSCGWRRKQRETCK
jgi:hypothetical protein